MSDEERREILERIKSSIAEAATLSKDEARRRLAAEGFCDERGRLSPAYGGKVSSDA
jgi:hypothetical protein